MNRLLIGLTLLALSAPAQQVRTIGRGCCSNERPPTLEVDPFGAIVEASGVGAPPAAAGGLLISPPPSGPLSASHGDFVFLDPNTIVGGVTIIADDAGRWDVSLPIPPGIELTDIVLQAVFIDLQMSTGLAFSDAVRVIF